MAWSQRSSAHVNMLSEIQLQWQVVGGITYLAIGSANGVNSSVIEASTGDFKRMEIAIDAEFVSFVVFDRHQVAVAGLMPVIPRHFWFRSAYHLASETDWVGQLDASIACSHREMWRHQDIIIFWFIKTTVWQSIELPDE